MKISIITVSYNAVETISDAVESVLSQQYENIEHIVIDGGSTDGTLDILHKYQDDFSKLISEPDAGIYDAMNKGAQNATGDVIGYLNADDVLHDPEVLATIADRFQSQHCDAVYGNLAYVEQQDISNIVRYWKSGKLDECKLKRGWIPPHPTFYMRTNLFHELGGFNRQYKLAADYDLMLRTIERTDVKLCYLDKLLVRMRLGGVTNSRWSNVIKQNLEILHSAREQQLSHSSLIFLVKRVTWKLSQYLARPDTDG